MIDESEEEKNLALDFAHCYCGNHYWHHVAWSISPANIGIVTATWVTCITSSAEPSGRARSAIRSNCHSSCVFPRLGDLAKKSKNQTVIEASLRSISLEDEPALGTFF